MRRLLLGCLALAAGCGGPAPPPTPPPIAVAAPAPSPPPVTELAPPPPPPAELSELDPARHVTPATPAAGRLGGKPFAPTAAVTGTVLTFADPADPGRAVTIPLPDLAPGVRVVRPGQDAGAGVPLVTVAAGDALAGFANAYAMTLTVTGADAKTVRGSVHLVLPDAARSYLAGAFAADVRRGLADPPGATDEPFVAGPVAVAAGLTGDLEVGYVGAPGGLAAADVVGHPVTPGDAVVTARSDSFPPRVTTLARSAAGAWQYDHSHLAPGRYLVYAKIKPGPAAWAWADVPAAGRAAVPLTLDPAATAAVTVTVPTGFAGEVELLPADPVPGNAVPDIALASALGYKTTPAAGVATFQAVAAGTYRVVGGGRAAAATVTGGKPAAVTLGGK